MQELRLEVEEARRGEETAREAAAELEMQLASLKETYLNGVRASVQSIRQVTAAMTAAIISPIFDAPPRLLLEPLCLLRLCACVSMLTLSTVCVYTFILSLCTSFVGTCPPRYVSMPARAAVPRQVSPRQIRGVWFGA